MAPSGCTFAIGPRNSARESLTGDHVTGAGRRSKARFVQKREKTEDGNGRRVDHDDRAWRHTRGYSLDSEQGIFRPEWLFN